jgi:predicted nicotinamide N-methyase
VAVAEKIVGAHPGAVAEAMRRVLEAGAGGDLAARAKAVLEQAER